MTDYLKKPDAPDWDYHIATPYLLARGDMLPYVPEQKVPLQGILASQSEEKPVPVKPMAMKLKPKTRTGK